VPPEYAGKFGGVQNGLNGTEGDNGVEGWGKTGVWCITIHRQPQNPWGWGGKEAVDWVPGSGTDFTAMIWLSTKECHLEEVRIEGSYTLRRHRSSKPKKFFLNIRIRFRGWQVTMPLRKEEGR